MFHRFKDHTGITSLVVWLPSGLGFNARGEHSEGNHCQSGSLLGRDPVSEGVCLHTDAYPLNKTLLVFRCHHRTQFCCFRPTRLPPECLTASWPELDRGVDFLGHVAPLLWGELQLDEEIRQDASSLRHQFRAALATISKVVFLEKVKKAEQSRDLIHILLQAESWKCKSSQLIEKSKCQMGKGGGERERGVHMDALKAFPRRGWARD